MWEFGVQGLGTMSLVVGRNGACCHIFEYRWARMEPDEYGNHAPALAIWEVLKRMKTAWSAKPP